MNKACRDIKSGRLILLEKKPGSLRGIGLLKLAPHHDPIWALGDHRKALIFQLRIIFYNSGLPESQLYGGHTWKRGIFFSGAGLCCSPNSMLLVAPGEGPQHVKAMLPSIGWRV
jgi:hypothetical protein